MPSHHPRSRRSSRTRLLANLSGAVGAPLGKAQGVGTIVNDDLPPAPSVTASAATFNGGETMTLPSPTARAIGATGSRSFPPPRPIATSRGRTSTTRKPCPAAARRRHAALHRAAHDGHLQFPALRRRASHRDQRHGHRAAAASADPRRVGDHGQCRRRDHRDRHQRARNLGDWVALYPAAAADTGYIAWAYLSDSRIRPPGSGMANAMLHFTAPLTPGPYSPRFFAPGFTKIATSATVTVLTVPTLRIEDVSVTEGDSGTTTAIFTVTLAPTSADPVTVYYTTADETATSATPTTSPRAAR